MKMKRITSILLIICMMFSIATASVAQAYAADGETQPQQPTEAPPLVSKSFDGFVKNQFYARGMSAAGTILNKLGSVTENETVKEITSFISSWVFGSSDTGETLAEIQNTCNEILSVVTDVEEISENVESLENAQSIKDAATACDNARVNQIENVINASNTEDSIANVYDAYVDCFSYASGYEELPYSKDLEDFEAIYEEALIDLCALNTDEQYHGNSAGRDAYYKHIMYTSDVIDSILKSKITSLLNNLKYTGEGNRYVDKAALYAYYALPFSTDQAEFVDEAVEYQLDQIVMLCMLYNDFLAQRAQYYVELNEQQLDGFKTIEECDSELNEYLKMYQKTMQLFEEKVAKFLSDPICLNDGYINKTTTTLDSYMRESADSNTAHTYNLVNTNCKDSYSTNYTGGKTHVSNASFTKEALPFYKNASVTIKDNKLVFTPFYILDGSKIAKDNTMLKKFKEYESYRCINTMFMAYCRSCDYINLKNGVFSDGVNNYKTVTSVDEFKKLINPTYYSAYGKTAYTYFADYLNYASSDSLYLLINSKSSDGTAYYKSCQKHPFFNMKNGGSYSTTWGSENICEWDFANQKYALFLVPQSGTFTSKVDTSLVGEGEVTLTGLNNGTATSGSRIDVNITVPENYKISKITALYHDDAKNPANVTGEQVICTDITNNDFTLSYAVPYSNVTLKIETTAL